MLNPLLDYKFLYDLDKHRNRVTYVRITNLTLDQLPIEQIEGVATGGSITIDGTSNVRRICSLTMSTKNLNINNVYWGVTTKVKLELGLKNNLVGYSYYDDIIWFPMGTYVLNDFKTSALVNNYTISLSGKDKMCLLNGDISGEFNAETDLGVEEVWDNEILGFVKVKRPINYIIREMVHHYAQEDYANIIVKDIRNSLEILTNRTGHNIYIIRNIDNSEIEEVTYDLMTTSEYHYSNGLIVDFSLLEDLINTGAFIPSIFVDEDDLNLIDSDKEPSLIYKDSKYYTVSQIKPGDDLGYGLQLTEFPEDLIAAAGDTVTSVLDKIIKYFTNYEYFYNAQGLFVFQEKLTYVNTAWNGIIRLDKENFVDPSAVRSKVLYSFEGSPLVSANLNTPNIGKIKNDYTVWGKKKTTSGGEYPIHMRYAIDIKPKAYRTYDGKIYATEEFSEKYFSGWKNVVIVDWREIIYQMALDYYAHNHDDDYSVKVRTNNFISNYLLQSNSDEYSSEATYYILQNDKFTELPLVEDLFNENKSKYYVRQGSADDSLYPLNLYPTGRTKYEQYYHDIQGFWRKLYIPTGEKEKYFSKKRILSGVTQRPIEGNFEWTETGCIIGDDTKLGTIDSYSSTMYYYIGEDKIIRSVEDDSELIENDIVYTLDLLVLRDKIIQKILDESLALVEELINEKLTIRRTKVAENKKLKAELSKLAKDSELLKELIELVINNSLETLPKEWLMVKGEYGDPPVEYDITILGTSNLLRNLLNELLELNTLIAAIDTLVNSLTLEIEQLDENLSNLEITRRDFLRQIQVASAALAPYNFTYFCEEDSEEGFYKNVTYTLHGFPEYEIDEEFEDRYKEYNKFIAIDPSSLIFWFDFFDADSLGLGLFSVPAIGDRPKTVNNDGIRALIYLDVPDVILIKEETLAKVEDENDILDGYNIIVLEEPQRTLEEYRQELLEQATTDEEKQEILERIDTNAIETEEEGIGRLGFWRWFMEDNKIYRSARSTTALEEIDNLLYTTAYCNENITITSIPIYYLIPNTIISADDELRNIGGYYILDKMTIPLNYNGTMLSTAIKVPERIY